MNTVEERSGELWVVMQARRLGFGRNPLRRRTDRLEAALLWCGLVAALLLIPVGAAIGTNVRDAGEASAERYRAGLHEVKARTLEGTERDIPSAPGDVLSRARVSYIDPQGVEREGMTSVVIGTKAGDEVTIWVDQSGAIVHAPRSGLDSAAIGTTVGLLTIAGSWLLLWGAVRLARVPLDRRRARDWENEWNSVAPRWLRGQK
jgi:hypothetical protein